MNIFQEWIDAAVADGWVEYPGGPWGLQDHERGNDPLTGQHYHTGARHAGDRSVLLHGSGTFVGWIVWLVDRDGDPHPWTVAWSEHGLHHLGPLPAAYDPAAVAELATLCCHCRKPATSLRPISFAGRVCASCDTPELRGLMEPAGWAQ